MLTVLKFNAIKILLDGGADIKEVCETLQVTETTVLLVKRCGTYEQYKQENSAVKFLARKQKSGWKNKPEPEPEPERKPVPEREIVHTVQVTANHYMMEELKEHTRLLTLIGSKLTAIIDDLYGTGEKKL